RTPQGTGVSWRVSSRGRSRKAAARSRTPPRGGGLALDTALGETHLSGARHETGTDAGQSRSWSQTGTAAALCFPATPATSAGSATWTTLTAANTPTKDVRSAVSTAGPRAP